MENIPSPSNADASETIFLNDDILFTGQDMKTHLPRSKKKIIKKQLYREKRVERRKIEHQNRRKNKKKTPDVGVVECQKVNVCIDLDFYGLMSDKEKGKLFRQLCRVWGLEKKFTGLQTTLLNGTNDFYERGSRLVSGFENFNWQRESGSISDVYKDAKNIVYLSPDSTCKPLLEVDPQTTYVIGGLVDESGVGSKSLEKATNLAMNCQRLPIREIMQKGSKGSYNEMLSINLVVEILCKVSSGQSFEKAFSDVLPKRFGFTLNKKLKDMDEYKTDDVFGFTYDPVIRIDQEKSSLKLTEEELAQLKDDIFTEQIKNSSPSTKIASPECKEIVEDKESGKEDFFTEQILTNYDEVKTISKDSQKYTEETMGIFYGEKIKHYNKAHKNTLNGGEEDEMSSVFYSTNIVDDYKVNGNISNEIQDYEEKKMSNCSNQKIENDNKVDKNTSNGFEGSMKSEMKNVSSEKKQNVGNTFDHIFKDLEKKMTEPITDKNFQDNHKVGSNNSNRVQDFKKQKMTEIFDKNEQYNDGVNENYSILDAKEVIEKSQSEAETLKNVISQPMFVSEGDYGIQMIRQQMDKCWKYNKEELAKYLAKRIIYEDDSLIAFDKPYYLAYSGRGKEGSINMDTCLQELKKLVAPDVDRLHLVRSLDKQYSGLILFAKSSQERERYLDIIAEGKATFNYNVLVSGIPKLEEGVINFPLVKLLRGEGDILVKPAVQEKISNNSSVPIVFATTKYRIIAKNTRAHMSHLEVTVNKEWTHQIRSHLSFGLNTPLIGDYKYNPKNRQDVLNPPKFTNEATNLLDLSTNYGYRKVPMLFHLRHIAFPGYKQSNKKVLNINCPLPTYMKFILNKLRLLKK